MRIIPVSFYDGRGRLAGFAECPMETPSGFEPVTNFERKYLGQWY